MRYIYVLQEVSFDYYEFIDVVGASNTLTEAKKLAKAALADGRYARILRISRTIPGDITSTKDVGEFYCHDSYFTDKKDRKVHWRDECQHRE